MYPIAPYKDVMPETKVLVLPSDYLTPGHGACVEYVGGVGSTDRQSIAQAKQYLGFFWKITGVWICLGGIFNPLGFGKDNMAEMKQKEIKNGRLAMLSILGFLAQVRTFLWVQWIPISFAYVSSTKDHGGIPYAPGSRLAELLPCSKATCLRMMSTMLTSIELALPLDHFACLP
jgi:hypothetical protein